MPVEPNQQAAWQLNLSRPGALALLAKHVRAESIRCWVLVGLAATATIPLSQIVYMLIMVGIALITDNFELLESDMFWALGGGLTMVVQAFLALFVRILLPAAVIAAGILVYNKRKAIVVHDLVHGDIALTIVDEVFGREIEFLRAQRFRPNASPVPLGTDFVSRVNHFAYHYMTYRRMSHAPAELKVPMVAQSNFWWMLTGVGFATCCSPFGGCLLAIPLMVRVILVWPRVLAAKVAALEFFGGKHDPAIAQLANRAPQQAASTEPII